MLPTTLNIFSETSARLLHKCFIRAPNSQLVIYLSSYSLHVQRERKQILEMLRERHQTEERNLKHQLKLKQDVEMEKLRKVHLRVYCVSGT